jgi:hypothetical protein
MYADNVFVEVLRNSEASWPLFHSLTFLRWCYEGDKGGRCKLEFSVKA